jgi:DNA-binding NtrC family response regulator
MLCRGDVLSTQDFFPHDPSVEPADPVRRLVGATLYDVEKHLIMSTLQKVDGNKTRAAEILGITPRTIRNKLRQYMVEQHSEEECEN